jgi:hypothetical protein
MPPGGSYDAFTFGSGTDAFDGPNGAPGNQDIVGAVAPVFGTLVVNVGVGNLLTIANTAGASIGTGLTLTSGIISNRALGSTAPLVFLNTAASPSASLTSFVDGYVSKAGNTAFTFPLGDLAAAAGNRYQPLAIGIPSAATTVTAAYVAGILPNNTNLDAAVSSIDPAAHWVFNSTTSATAVVTITTPDEMAVYGPSAPVFIAGLNKVTGSWENVSGSSSPATRANQALSSAVIDISQYSAFAVGSTLTPLPITLVSFVATADGCNANLSWQTALEQNSSHYEIELSTDGAGFNKVAEVKSRNSATGAEYSYPYKGLSSRVNYFRLRAVDLDGKATYSPIVSVISNCTIGGKIVVSPNPATHLINVQGLDDGRNQILLFDIKGKKLVEQTGTGTRQSLPVSRYPKGIYILRVINADGTVVYIKVSKE